MKRFGLVLAVLLSLVGRSAWGVVPYSYTVTDLGTLGGPSSSATGINANGQVIGYAQNAAGYEHAFLWSSSGGMQDLGTLGGSGFEGSQGLMEGSQALGINNSGQVVGWAANSSEWAHAFLWTSGGGMQDIGTLGGSSSWAYGINDSGQIVGYGASIPTNSTHAFLWASGGGMQDLGTLPGGSESWAFGISNSGQVVGSAVSNSNGDYHAFLWGSSGGMQDLGTLGGSSSNSQANGINNSGQVVGYSGSSSGTGHVFVWTSSGGMQDPGTLPNYSYNGTYATGINNNGQVVGYGENSRDIDHAFLYSNGTMIDLNSLIPSGWTLNQATAINDNGLIVGYGVNPSGHTDAFLLTPIPEPSTFALLGIGAISLLGFAWRRRRGRARCLSCAAAVAAMLLAGSAQAQTNVFNMGGTYNQATGTWTGLASLQFVTVGNPGNAADPATGNLYGSVGYTYQMGQYDVTAGQYCQFLNAVAKTDTYGLYISAYLVPGSGGWETIGITQSGSSGNYSYSVSGSYSQAANCPIFGVNWGDAARFCNWLQNGQPSFPAGTPGEVAGSTETGTYALNGDTTNLLTETRNAGATYFLPSENEWYKAAFYKGGGTNAGYWTYPTRSNTVPSNVLSATGTNNANFWNNGTGAYSNPPYYLTPVGAFASSPGPYGTYDMGGDVWQWNETVVYDGMRRGVRGGACDWTPDALTAAGYQNYNYPWEQGRSFGFRVASLAVPEPSSLALLLAGAIGLLAYAWRRRRV